MSQLTPLAPLQYSRYQAPEQLECTLDFAQDKNYLITGAANGIGRSLALKLAQHGAQLILLDKDAKALEQTAETIQSQTGHEPLITEFDLCQMNGDTAQTFANNVSKEYSQLDGLIHLAGMLGQLTPLNQYPDYLWHQVMRAQLDSALLITQAFMPLLKHDGPAQVIVTTCQTATQPQAYWGAYAISKHSLLALATLWAQELRNTTHIRFNAVDPGPVATQLRQTAFPAEDPTTLIKADQCLNPFLFLLSDNHDMSLSGALITN